MRDATRAIRAGYPYNAAEQLLYIEAWVCSWPASDLCRQVELKIVQLLRM
jgi:hypothetical protein